MSSAPLLLSRVVLFNQLGSNHFPIKESATARLEAQPQPFFLEQTPRLHEIAPGRKRRHPARWFPAAQLGPSIRPRSRHVARAFSVMTEPIPAERQLAV